MKHIEHENQCAVVEWFRYQYPKNVIYAIPNGGKRNVREAARFKKEGVLAGVSDLFVMRAMGGYHGLYVEMKASTSLTTSQKLFIVEAVKEGYKVEVCYSSQEAIEAIKHYMTGENHERV